ncbi:hypothetical protein ACHAXS_000800, partial [Conticribra weissflogii]
MAPLESIRTKRYKLTSNLELSQCITVLSLFLTYTDKPLKRNLTTWLSLASSNPVVPLNGLPRHSLSPKRIITDIRSLNKAIIRKQYPLPIITDMLDRISGYIFFTKLDISMQYYTFELNEPSQELCVIVTPFGKYKYKRLPMGLKCAPDFAQQVMEEVLHDVEDTGVYLDDIRTFSFTWEHHMLLLNKILHQLEANGFTVNP